MHLLRAFQSILFLFILCSAGAQSKVDTNYIQRFPNKLVLSPYLSSSSNSLTIKPWNDRIDSSHSVDYEPNLRGGYGLSFSYRIVDFSIGFRQKLSAESERTYGKSTSLGIGFRLWASRKVLTEFSLQSVNGYANTSTPLYDTINFTRQNPYEHRQDLGVFLIKMRLVYQFNPDKFSYRASFGFSERQLKSSAGFLLSSQAYAEVVYADSALIPEKLRPHYGDAGRISEVSIAALGVAPGIGGTWTKGRWFLTGVLFVGIDLQRLGYDVPGTGTVKSERKFAANADFRFSFGYNTPRVFFGFQNSTDYNLLRPSKFKVNSSFNRSSLSIGYRFNSPKVVDKTYDAVVNTIIPKKLRKFMY